jgi:hypothetical protein
MPPVPPKRYTQAIGQQFAEMKKYDSEDEEKDYGEQMSHQ